MHVSKMYIISLHLKTRNSNILLDFLVLLSSVGKLTRLKGEHRQGDIDYGKTWGCLIPNMPP